MNARVKGFFTNVFGFLCALVFVSLLGLVVYWLGPTLVWAAIKALWLSLGGGG